MALAYLDWAATVALLLATTRRVLVAARLLSVLLVQEIPAARVVLVAQIASRVQVSLARAAVGDQARSRPVLVALAAAARAV